MIKQLVNYLRLHFPRLYFGMVGAYEKLTSGKPTIYIFDNCGGSFKEYIANHTMDQKLEILKNNLDEYSNHTVDVLFKRLLNYPERKYGLRIVPDDSFIIGGMLNEEQPETRKKVKHELRKISRNIKFPRNSMDPSVFYFDHGLIYLPVTIKEYLYNTDFIDLGAYFGDSALALTKYNYRKIYSVEFSKKAIENYRLWMKINNISPDKFEIIEAAMSASDDNPPIYLSGNDYSLYSDLRCEEKEARIKIKQRSLDSIVEQYHIQPKFIKADIEGYVLECMKGGETTLKKHRPVLSLAIYHNPYEFFETKPFLENLLDDYTFIIRKMAVKPLGLRSHAETMLMAYPNELKKY